MLPPDALSSAVRILDDTSAAVFDAFVKALPAGLLRVKGFVRLDGEIRLFSWVMGRADLHPIPPREIPGAMIGRLVFIGPEASLEPLAEGCRRPPFVRMP
jgi:hypothetical protein